MLNSYAIKNQIVFRAGKCQCSMFKISITNIRDMQNVLLLILDNYNLFTNNCLDYLDFKLVV
jgi:hypothetical protein